MDEYKNNILTSVCAANSLDDLISILSAIISDTGYFDGFTIALICDNDRYMRIALASLPEEFRAIESVYNCYQFPLTAYEKHIADYRKGNSKIIRKGFTDDFPKQAENQIQKLNLESMAISPIIAVERLSHEFIGALTFYSQKHVITQNEIDEVQGIAGYLYQSLNARLKLEHMDENRDLIRSASEEQEKFLDFIVGINSLTAIDLIYDKFARELFDRFKLNCLGFFQEENGLLVCKRSISSNMKDKRCIGWNRFCDDVVYEINPIAGAIPTSYIQRANVILNDMKDAIGLPMSENDRRGIQVLGNPRTFISIPVHDPIIKDQIPFVLVGWSLDEVADIGEPEIRVIEKLCSFLISSINNANLYNTVDKQKNEIDSLYHDLEKKAEMLNELATTDKLTGLKNFAYFQEVLGRKVSEYKRCAGEQFLSIVIIDIDHFKIFNDTYGHVNGNNALERVAELISGEARDMDVVCRYGGEEFIIVLPKSDINGAFSFAERARKALEKNILIIEDQKLNISISAGCAEYMPDESTESFIKRADQALYKAKEGGRNRVEKE